MFKLFTLDLHRCLEVQWSNFLTNTTTELVFPSVPRQHLTKLQIPPLHQLSNRKQKMQRGQLGVLPFFAIFNSKARAQYTATRCVNLTRRK